MNIILKNYASHTHIFLLQNISLDFNFFFLTYSGTIYCSKTSFFIVCFGAISMLVLIVQTHFNEYKFLFTEKDII